MDTQTARNTTSEAYSQADGPNSVPSPPRDLASAIHPGNDVPSITSIVEMGAVPACLRKGGYGPIGEFPTFSSLGQIPPQIHPSAITPFSWDSDGFSNGTRTAPSYYFVIGTSENPNGPNEGRTDGDGTPSFGRTDTMVVPTPPEAA